MVSGHIVRAFDEDLKHLSAIIVEMGGIAEKQLADALQALTARDTALAERVVAEDARLDALERELDAATIQFLALRQPMADDLREVVTALKISHTVERIGDYAANLAKRTTALNQLPPAEPVHSVPRMGRLAQTLIKDVLDAYVRHDADQAIAVWQGDAELDKLYDSLFRELLTYMMEDARNITPCTHLLFIAKSIERIGDHATNIAELVYFLVHGEPLTEARPKGDTTSFTVVAPGDDEGAA